MSIALRKPALGIIIATAMTVAVGAHATGLYKSVDRDGRVTFSDIPVDGAVSVQRIAASESAKPAQGAAPIYLALAEGFDEAVTQANTKVDMAEHALALARSALLESDPLSLHGPKLSRDDAQKLEFFKRDVLNARRQLLRVLQQRNNTVTRPLA